MKTFKYEQFRYHWGGNWVDWLNDLGKQGWELCDAVRDYDEKITWCIFKKEMNVVYEPTKEEI